MQMTKNDISAAITAYWLAANRHISAAGKAPIAAAGRKRWTAWRKQKAKAARGARE